MVWIPLKADLTSITAMPHMAITQNWTYWNRSQAERTSLACAHHFFIGGAGSQDYSETPGVTVSQLLQTRSQHTQVHQNYYDTESCNMNKLCGAHHGILLYWVGAFHNSWPTWHSAWGIVPWVLILGLSWNQSGFVHHCFMMTTNLNPWCWWGCKYCRC